MLNQILVQATSPSSEELQFHCGSAVSSMCEGKTVSMDPAGWQLLVGELVGSINFLATGLAQGMASEASFNLMRAINAFRCSILSVGDNGWYLIAAVWHLMKQFGEE